MSIEVRLLCAENGQELEAPEVFMAASIQDARNRVESRFSNVTYQPTESGEFHCYDGVWDFIHVATIYVPADVPLPCDFGGKPMFCEIADNGSSTVRSAMVGTVYTRLSPDDPPLVKVGDSLTPFTIVCLIEALKVFTVVYAETEGTVSKVLVNDRDSVDWGQVLFEVDRRS